ncbi:hypothetical protein ABEG17_02430 [Pedococcus sp. KACC 23699]|uniref:Uncharacterized protein n=1 Tax=Pedococcus sp. KACC 23699 TaxID=3149228 RepID=A0AAU7JVC7_9MICO
MPKQPNLSLHLNPDDQTIRLEGWAEIEHPRCGRGGYFSIALKAQTVEDELRPFAAAIANHVHAQLFAIPILGTVWWGPKWGSNQSDIVMVHIYRQDNHLALSVTVRDVWSDELEEDDDTDVLLFRISNIVPSLIVDALAYLHHRSTEMAHVGHRVMAGLNPHEPSISDSALVTLAALRLPDAAVPSQPVSGRFALPLI